MTELCSLWLYTRVEARENEAHVNRRYTQWALLNVLGTVGQYIAPPHKILKSLIEISKHKS